MGNIGVMIKAFNEANREQIAIWGDDPFTGISPALLRIRKAKILFGHESNGALAWYLTLWRARAIRTLCDTAGVCPYPLLLALLYWPLVDTTPEERAEQLRCFRHQLETVTMERIIEEASVWGIDSNDTLCQIFGLAQFGLGTADDDALFWVARATEWPLSNEVSMPLGDTHLALWHKPGVQVPSQHEAQEILQGGQEQTKVVSKLCDLLIGRGVVDDHIRYYRRFVETCNELDCVKLIGYLGNYGYPTYKEKKDEV